MTHDEVRALLLSFPGVEDGVSYGEPSFKVAGKFFTWMRPALDGFAAALDAVDWHAPRCAVALNVSGALSRQTSALRPALAAQIASTVQWQACMQSVAERQPHCVLEIGAGTALARLWNARYPAIAARSLDEFKDPAGALQWLERHGARD